MAYCHLIQLESRIMHGRTKNLLNLDILTLPLKKVGLIAVESGIRAANKSIGE
jgi:hypothetical protein